jgi:hypothetical protein
LFLIIRNARFNILVLDFLLVRIQSDLKVDVIIDLKTFGLTIKQNKNVPLGHYRFHHLIQGINVACESEHLSMSSNDLDLVGVVNSLLRSSMEVNPKVSGLRISIITNFSEKRTITKAKLLRNPLGCLGPESSNILAPGFADLYQISMIGLKMITQSDERYILGLAVEEGTVDVAVYTVNFMDFQFLQQGKVIFEKIEFFIKNKKFQTVLKLKNYYATWTLRIEVVNGKKIFIIVISEFIL